MQCDDDAHAFFFLYWRNRLILSAALHHSHHRLQHSIPFHFMYNVCIYFCIWLLFWFPSMLLLIFSINFSFSWLYIHTQFAWLKSIFACYLPWLLWGLVCRLFIFPQNVKIKFKILSRFDAISNDAWCWFNSPFAIR